MTKADSVHSTPRLNTPVDPTRRNFLSTAAGGAVAVVAGLPAAAAAVDPAFALMAEKLGGRRRPL